MASEQINLRLNPPLLKAARTQARRRGFSTIQAFIQEAVRAQVYDPELTAAEWRVVERQIREVEKGRTIPGDIALARMRELASGKRGSRRKISS